MSTSVNIWMIDHQGTPGAVNLGLLVVVELNIHNLLYISRVEEYHLWYSERKAIRRLHSKD